MTKNEVISYLKNIPENNDISEILLKLENINEDEFQNLLTQKGINSLEDVQNFVNEKVLNEHKDASSKFENLNDIVSYGITDKTLHIHLVPKDARSFLTKDGLKIAEGELIDALQKIQELLKKEEKQEINSVYAVSGIMKGPIAKIFKNLGFDVRIEKNEKAKDDPELGKFYEIFKDKKDIGRAAIGREKFMSEEYKSLLYARKNELGIKTENKQEKNFISELRESTYSQDEIVQKSTSTKEENTIAKEEQKHEL